MGRGPEIRMALLPERRGWVRFLIKLRQLLLPEGKVARAHRAVNRPAVTVHDAKLQRIWAIDVRKYPTFENFFEKIFKTVPFSHINRPNPL